MLRFLFIVFMYQLLYASEAWKFDSIYDGDSISQNQSSQTILYRASDTTKHIFYGGDHLYHLIQDDSGNVTQETVDDSEHVGSFISSALGSDGTLHVAYIDTQNSRLKYASKALGENWNIVSTALPANSATSICVDTLNIAHILYETNESSDLYLTTSSNIASGGVFRHNASKGSIACANNDIHIAYVSTAENKGLWYFNGNTLIGRHIFATLEPIYATSIDVNTSDTQKAIGIYYNGNFKIFDTLGEAWHNSDDYATGSKGAPSVKLKNGNVYASFLVRFTKSYTLELYKKDTNGVVSTTRLPSSRHAYSNSLVFINSDAYVQYSDVAQQKIALIHEGAADWLVETLRKTGALKNDFNLDMLVTPYGPRLTFETPYNSIEYLARNSDGSWSSNPIPLSNVAAPIITYTDDAFLTTWIQYYRVDTGVLERSSYFSILKQWHLAEAENIIADANIANYANNGRIHDSVVSGHITHSCFINDNADLFYVRNNNVDGWSQKIELDPNDELKLECAIDVDEKANVHIVYSTQEASGGLVHQVNDKLYYISNELGNWDTPQRLLEHLSSNKNNLHISSKQSSSIHIGFENSGRIRYVKGSMQATRVWPENSVVMPLSPYGAIDISQKVIFDMSVDSNMKVHFVRVMGNYLYHTIGKEESFTTKSTNVGFEIKGIKTTVSQNTLHAIMENVKDGDLIYGELPINTVSPSIIMYLLN